MAALNPLPQCILLDVVLPDGPGEVILERIRAENLPCRVIIGSSDYDRGRLKAVHDMRPAAVLLKPVGLSELIAACYVPASWEDPAGIRGHSWIRSGSGGGDKGSFLDTVGLWGNWEVHSFGLDAAVPSLSQSEASCPEHSKDDENQE